MKILHISNDFSLTKVHSNLYRTLDGMSLEQTVFNPVREATPVGNNHIDFKVSTSSILYSKKLRKRHRFLFRSKIAYLYRDLKSRTDLSTYSAVHATTLFSDGAIALKIKKAYGVPYIVAVRATDIDVFLKYRRDLQFKMHTILREASVIIFIADSLKKRFLEHPLIKKHRGRLEPKCQIVYNGIDSFWLDNLSAPKKGPANKILYVGRLISRKNIVEVATAVLKLNEKGIPCEINFVGSGQEEEQKIRALAEQHKGKVNFLGAISDKSKLREVYRENYIFAMPSKGETFGLVYIEALSQGLPVLYTENEGIDGVFKVNIGEKCDGTNVGEIVQSLEKMINNYDCYEPDKIDFSIFRWEYIAQQYYKLYTNVSQE